MEKVVCESDSDMKRIYEYLVPDIAKSNFILAMIYEPTSPLIFL